MRVLCIGVLRSMPYVPCLWYSQYVLVFLIICLLLIVRRDTLLSLVSLTTRAYFVVMIVCAGSVQYQVHLRICTIQIQPTKPFPTIDTYLSKLHVRLRRGKHESQITRAEQDSICPEVCRSWEWASILLQSSILVRSSMLVEVQYTATIRYTATVTYTAAVQYTASIRYTAAIQYTASIQYTG